MAIIYQDSVKSLCARVAERITAQLLAGKVPWVRPYDHKAGLPFNVFRRAREKHKESYSGVNRFLLELEMWANGWPSPAFLTINQLKQLNPLKDPDGPRIRRLDGKVPLSADDWKHHGQQPCHVVIFREHTSWVKDGKKVPADTAGAEEREHFFGRAYAVFNVAQIENLPADLAAAAGAAETAWRPQCVPAEVLAAIEGMSLAGGVVTAQMPCYWPALDRIGMPPFSAFVGEDAYLATLLHEAGHAAGNAARVGREPRGETKAEKVAAYAREELCAELTSAFAMAAFGLPSSQELQHVGYVQSYIELLKAEPSILVWAASQAEKRTSYLVEKARERASLALAAAE